MNIVVVTYVQAVAAVKPGGRGCLSPEPGFSVIVLRRFHSPPARQSRALASSLRLSPVALLLRSLTLGQIFPGKTTVVVSDVYMPVEGNVYIIIQTIIC